MSSTGPELSAAPLNVIVVAAVPIFIELHLGPHLELFERLGYVVTIASSDPPNYSYKFERVPFSRRSVSFGAHLKSFFAMRKMMKRQAASGSVLLHLHTPIAAAIARLAVPRRLRSQITVVYMAHGLHFLPGQRGPFWFVERLLASRTDLLIVMNSADETSALNLGVGRVETIPGVGCSRLRIRAKQSPSSPNRRVALVGVLEGRKRPLLAVEAMIHLPKSVVLDVYGSGPLEKEMRDVAGELGVLDRVNFWGWTSDLEEAYSSADCLLFPSAQEGLPMAVVEAIGAALPVVAFDIRGVRDILQPLDSWHIPSEVCPEQVAIAVTDALHTPVDVQACHTRAQEFSVSSAVAAHSKILCSLNGELRI